MSPGNAHAAPSGVTASADAASSSWVGTLPCHSSEARNTPTGTTTTRTTSTNSPDNSRERRSTQEERRQRHAHACEQHAGRDAQDRTDRGGDPGRALLAPHDRRADREHEERHRRHADEPEESEDRGELPARETQHREPPRIERIVGSADERGQSEAQGHRRAAEDSDDQDDIGRGVPQRQQGPGCCGDRPRRARPDR